MKKRIIYSILYKLPNSFFPYIIELILKISFLAPSKGNGLLIINTHDRSGGASKIAFQLASFMQKKKKTSMLVMHKNRNEKWIHNLKTNEEVFDTVFSNYLNDKEKQGGWLDFSKLSLIKSINFTFFNDAHILHLHNLHGGYFSYALLPYLSKRKKLIWTLHDEHLITGHCSFSMQCLNWKNNCLSCNFLSIYPAIQVDNAKSLKKFKERWIKKSAITYVTPSHWLSNRLQEVYPFVNKVEVIPNGIDTSIFQQKDRKECRDKFKLPNEKFLVLFIAEYATNNPFKGGETIRELIQLNTNTDIVFVTIGGSITTRDSNFIELPYISNELDLVCLYSACDLMIYPTNADNHPLVVMEAMSCKLPVLAPKIGGIPEIVANEIDGWLVEAYSKPEIYLLLLRKLYNIKIDDESVFNNFGENSRIKIQNYFSQEVMLEKYERLYTDV